MLACLDSISNGLPPLPARYGREYIKLEKKVLESKLEHLLENVDAENIDYQYEWIIQKLGFIMSDLNKDEKSKRKLNTQQI